MALALGLALERLFPLRPVREPNLPRRIAVNAGVAGSSYWISKWSAAAPLIALSFWASENQFGLIPRLTMLLRLDSEGPTILILTLLLLDWSLYAWHRLNHTLPLLWRFHRVHHADPDMDSTTAIRFHFGEFFFSNLYRAAQITLIGVPPEVLGLFELIVTFAAIFHHSNFRLPARLDRFLSAFIATPRIHSVHHSVLESETRSNYGSLLLFWDKLHGSLNTKRLNSVGEIEIGDIPWSEPRFRGLAATLLLPFKRTSSWKT
jgi:sterol desaturase/sphingolipid hydroxylase (fatty acid hydroxylase superfamily)